jgi:hypothetical protein
MCSLSGFPALPPMGHISLCEVDGRVHSMHAEEADVHMFTYTVSICPDDFINALLIHGLLFVVLRGNCRI